MPDLGEVRPEDSVLHILLAERPQEVTGITADISVTPDFIGKWKIDMGDFGITEAFFGLNAWSFGQIRQNSGPPGVGYGWVFSLDDQPGSWDDPLFADLSTTSSSYVFGTGTNPQRNLFDPDDDGLFIGFAAYGGTPTNFDTRKMFGYAEIIVPAANGTVTRLI